MYILREINAAALTGGSVNVNSFLAYLYNLKSLIGRAINEIKSIFRLHHIDIVPYLLNTFSIIDYKKEKLVET